MGQFSDLCPECGRLAPRIPFKDGFGCAACGYVTYEDKPGSALPDDNPKTAFGVKKWSLADVPVIALYWLGKVCKNGAAKYGRMNWRQNSVTASIYYDAAQRHLMAWYDGEHRDAESGCHPLAHVMACCAIIIDAEQHQCLNDDRPLSGRFVSAIAMDANKEDSHDG